MRDTPPSLSPRRLAVGALAITLVFAANAFARAVPLPPRRPAEFAPRLPAPGVEAPPPATQKTEPPTVPSIDTSQPPPSLPRAPREKMRACATEWTKLKMEKKGEPPVWRDFATQCLTR